MNGKLYTIAKVQSDKSSLLGRCVPSALNSELVLAAMPKTRLPITNGARELRDSPAMAR